MLFIKGEQFCKESFSMPLPGKQFLVFALLVLTLFRVGTFSCHLYFLFIFDCIEGFEYSVN